MRLQSFISILFTASMVCAQTTPELLSIDHCRELALSHNKDIAISREKVKSAEYQQKEAFAAYLPSIDFAGGYLYNQKEISIFDSDQLLPTKTFNPLTQSYEFNIAKNPLTGEPIKGPSGQYIPETVALIPKEAMTYDIHNVFFGAVTLTQPVYMGGKIRALNRMAQYAHDAAASLAENEEQNIIYAVDGAYWQVVSLKAKLRLASSYVELVDSLARNVEVMLQQGVATRSDQLSVQVRLNSANVDLTKVQNGLALSRMALAQLCGLPIDYSFSLADEDRDITSCAIAPDTHFDMEQVYDQRQDLRALQSSVSIASEKAKVARADMLPTVALIGAYSFSNPNMFDGFSKSFSGAFSVGAMVKIPLWHWGGNMSKYQRAQSDVTVSALKLDDAKEKVALQVNQAAFRTDEAVKTYTATLANLDAANENLRTAQIAFREGVATADDVMAAQTAWLKANSECIDAMIDVRLCDTYLKKTLGRLK